MIFLKRKRLIFWLLKAYFRKWKRTILLSFFLGLFGFFLFYLFIGIFKPLPFSKNLSIGIVGSYTKENLPADVLDKLSYGLTTVAENGDIKPMASLGWVIKNSGKTYIFYLKDSLYFSDKKRFTSADVSYNFKDVVVERPDKKTIIFKLKNSYSPFLVTASRPIFRKDYIGLGEYKLKSFDLNGQFVQSVILKNLKSGIVLTYKFYPTEESLKIALLLGEIDKTEDISNLSVLEKNLASFKNLKMEKNVNYNKLVTVFYNVQNKDLSDKRLREALNYALPNEFSEGLRSHTPYQPMFWVNQEKSLAFSQDLEHARRLYKESSATSSAKLSFTLKTLPKFKNTALELQKSWKELGININIEEVYSLPSDFDIFLGEFIVSKDPDQYVLWHSNSDNNITGYKNLRIDKLLEDGRQITNTTERKRIYSDFQKYLLDDPPASFLYFPYYYTVSK